MSAVCDFYIECSERGVFPLEASVPRPGGVKLRAFWTKNRWGERFRVTGISVRDAIKWWNAGHDREVPAPAGMKDFLTCFCECELCDACGTVGRRHYFPIINSPEILCVDCA